MRPDAFEGNGVHAQRSEDVLQRHLDPGRAVHLIACLPDEDADVEVRATARDASTVQHLQSVIST